MVGEGATKRLTKAPNTKAKRAVIQRKGLFSHSTSFCTEWFSRRNEELCVDLVRASGQVILTRLVGNLPDQIAVK